MSKLNLQGIASKMSASQMKNVTGGNQTVIGEIADGGNDRTFPCTCPNGNTYRARSIDECREFCGV